MKLPPMLSLLLVPSSLAGTSSVPLNDLESSSVGHQNMLRLANGLLGGVTPPSFPWDISSNSVKFQRCQGLKTVQEDEHGLKSNIVERYVIFRLCPGHECASCHKHYGEYALELSEYLGIIGHYLHAAKSSMCNTCSTSCAAQETAKTEAELILHDFGTSCGKCDKECHMLGQLEDNGYIDALQFHRCSPIYQGPNNETLYAGPVCVDEGNGIDIGIFTDSYCSTQDTSRDILEFLVKDEQKLKLTYSFMKLTYRETCLSCEEDRTEGGHDLKADRQDTDKVKKFCERLYQRSSKCEAAHGFDVASELPGGESLIDEQRATCALLRKIKSHGHSSTFSDEEDLIDAELLGEEETQGLDIVLWIVVVAGVSFVLLALAIKRCCWPSPEHSSGAYPVESVKFSVERQDVTEESNSSNFEESGLLVE